MMRMRSTFLAVLLVASLAVLLWVRSGSEARPSKIESAESHSLIGKEVGAPDLAPEPNDGSARREARDDTATGLEPRESLAHLEIRFLDKLTREPVPWTRGILVRDEGARSARRKGLRGHSGPIQSKVADAHGALDLDAPSGCDLILRAFSEVSSVGSVEVLIQALSPGEQRACTVELRTDGIACFHGRVIAAESAIPIANAIVELTQTRSTYWDNPDGPRTPGLRLARIDGTHTDSSGLFEIRFPVRAELDVRIDAPGRSPCFVAVEPAHASAADALEIRLERSATLRARVTDAAGAPVGACLVRVWVECNKLIFPTPNSTLLRPSAITDSWRPDLDSDGRCVMPGLPAGVPLHVELRVDEKPVREDLEAVTLAPGEVRDVTWQVGAGCTLEGLVTDQFQSARPPPSSSDRTMLVFAITTDTCARLRNKRGSSSRPTANLNRITPICDRTPRKGTTAGGSR